MTEYDLDRDWRRFRSITPHLAVVGVVFVTALRPVEAGTVTIAHLADPSIASHQFDEFAGAVLNDAGQVAFIGSFDSSNVDGDTAIFRGDGGPLVLIAQEGLNLPGDPPGSFGYDDLLDPFTRTELAINDSGHVAFWTQVKGPTPPLIPANQAVVLFDGRSGVLVARTNEAPPDGNGVHYLIFRFIGLTEPGDVVFRTLLANADLAISGNAGIFFHSTRDPNRLQDVTRFVRTGDLVSPYGAPLDVFYGNSTTHFSDTGDIAHMAVLAEPDGRQIAYFASGAGEQAPPTKVGRGSEFGNWNFDGMSITTVSFDPAVNNAGDVAFTTGIGGGSFSASPSGLFRSRGPSFPLLLALTDDPTPDGNGALLRPSRPSVNDRLQVAYAASLNHTDGFLSDNSAIMLHTNGINRIVAREGDPTPASGRYGDLTGAPFALNHAGQIALQADVLDDVHGRRLYVSDVTETVELVRTGDTLENRSITELEFVGGASRQRNGFNELGQVAYRAVLDNGDEVVALTTPDIRWRRDPNSGGQGVREWGYATNWTVGILPGPVHDVYVQYPWPLVILTGPSADTTVQSLTIGDDPNRVTLTLQDGVALESRTDITFAGYTSLYVEMSGGDAPASGRLAAEGDISLWGELTISPIGGTQPRAGQAYEVISSKTGAIVGELAYHGPHIVETTSTNVTVTFIPSPGDASAVVTFTQCLGSPDGVPNPPGSLTLAGCLTAFDADDDGDVDLSDYATLDRLVSQ